MQESGYFTNCKIKIQERFFMEIKDKCVLVTGGGQGIGRALAIEFANQGAKVVVCARRLQPIAETVEIIKKAGGQALALQTDITDTAQVDRLVQTATDTFGPVDVLFNNAGSFRCISPFHEADPELWWQDVTVNIRGTFLMIHAVLPSMLKRDSGVIISMGGGRPAGGGAYAAGKAGVIQMTTTLAQELEILHSNVIAVSSGPGLVRTEMTTMQAESDAGQKWIPCIAEAFAKGETRAPEDIAKATMQMLKVVTIADRGKYYNPFTDFNNWK